MSTDEEQQKYLTDALKVVREQSFFMKRAMDGDSLNLALEHATEMLRELRTNLLTSKNYYELYMKVLDELRELEEYLSALQRVSRC
jgi:vacuolar protein sorting-associated protein 35